MSDAAATRRTIHPEIKVIDKAKGLVDYVASDESIDSHREIVKADGWRFARFQKNAPFVDSHDYWSIDKLLGRVESYEIKGGKLIERVKWAIDVPDCELAKLGFALTEGGYLKAVSVGFIPTKYSYQGCEDFPAVIASLKISAEEAVKVRCVYLEQEQIELSACIIGSNPNALAKAFHDGAVKEEMITKLGFGGDEEMNFLHRAAETYDSLDPLMQTMVRTEMSRIYRARNLTLSGKTTPPAPSPHTPGGGDAAKGLAAEGLTSICKRVVTLAQRRSVTA
jgi:hypothetical protein